MVPNDSVDLRPGLSAARDQGARGTCLAFALTGAHEHARAALARLSEDALYWGCKTVDGDWSSGTTIESAEEALRSYGQPAATVWPYDTQAVDGEALIPPAGISPDESWCRAGLERVRADLDEVCDTVAANNLVVLGLQITTQWLRVAEDGRLPPLEARDQVLGGHAVVAVGFDRNAQVLIVRNSWGEAWGARGHADLPFADLHSALLGAWIVPSTSLTPN